MAAGILLFQNLRLRQQLRETQARRDELRQSEQKLQEEMQAQRSAAAAAEQEIARLQNERQRSEQKPAKPGTEPAPPAELFLLSWRRHYVAQARSAAFLFPRRRRRQSIVTTRGRRLFSLSRGIGRSGCPSNSVASTESQVRAEEPQY